MLQYFKFALKLTTISLAGQHNWLWCELHELWGPWGTGKANWTRLCQILEGDLWLWLCYKTWRFLYSHGGWHQQNSAGSKSCGWILLEIWVQVVAQCFVKKIRHNSTFDHKQIDLRVPRKPLFNFWNNVDKYCSLLNYIVCER